MRTRIRSVIRPSNSPLALTCEFSRTSRGVSHSTNGRLWRRSSRWFRRFAMKSFAFFFHESGIESGVTPNYARLNHDPRIVTAGSVRSPAGDTAIRPGAQPFGGRESCKRPVHGFGSQGAFRHLASDGKIPGV